MRWTEALVIDVLRQAYLPDPDVPHQLDEWALLPQVTLRCGGNERRIDALAVRCLPGGRGFERIAFEVKTSRADFRNETGEKRAPAEAVAHECVYVAPAGVIPVSELPRGWGLVEVHDTAVRPSVNPALGDRGVWVVKPYRRTPRIALDDLTAVLARRASRAEDRIRRAHDASPAEVARLRHEQDRLSRLLYSAEQRIARAQEEAREARYELLALAGDQVCADCGHKIAWKRAKGLGAEWKHKSSADDRACSKARAEADRRAKIAATGSDYGWGSAAPVEPRAFREMRAARQQIEQEAS